MRSDLRIQTIALRGSTLMNVIRIEIIDLRTNL